MDPSIVPTQNPNWTDPSEQAPSAKMEAGAQQQGLRGSVRYLVNNGNEQGATDEHQIINDLRQVGYAPLGMSSDGMMITLDGPQGPYDVKTKDVLGKMGWQVEGIMPANADYDNIDMGLRALVEGPSIRHDDVAKEGALKAHLQRRGIEDPQIIGSGSDWYVFNPQTSQYIALTNKPGMDVSDISEGAVRAPGILGGAAGGLLGGLGGSASGPGALAAAAGGSALGGFLGNRLSDAVVGAVNPEYLGHINSGNMVKDWAGDAGEDALAGVGGYGLGKLGGIGAKALRGGVLSPALKAGGSAARLGGQAFEGAANFMGKGLPRDLAVGALDPTGASAAAVLAQLPAQAVRGAARGIGKLGETGVANSLFPEAAASARQISRNLLKRRVADPSVGERFSGMFGVPRGTPGPVGAEEIVGNLGDTISQRMGHARARSAIAKDPTFFDGAEEAGEEAFRNARVSDASREGGQNLADAYAARARAQSQWATNAQGQRAADLAPDMSGLNKVGRGIRNMEQIGKAVEKAVYAPYDAAIGAVKYGAKAVKNAGTAAREVGRAVGPLEVPTALNYGSEELNRRMRLRHKALQNQGYGSKIMSEESLAQN